MKKSNNTGRQFINVKQTTVDSLSIDHIGAELTDDKHIKPFSYSGWPLNCETIKSEFKEEILT